MRQLLLLPHKTLAPPQKFFSPISTNSGHPYSKTIYKHHHHISLSSKNQQQPPLISSQTTTKSNPSHIFTTPSTNNTPKLTLHPPSNHHEPLSTINTPKLKLSNNPLLKKNLKFHPLLTQNPSHEIFTILTHYHLNSP
jgi:hypothetical protein